MSKKIGIAIRRSDGSGTSAISRNVPTIFGTNCILFFSPRLNHICRISSAARSRMSPCCSSTRDCLTKVNVSSWRDSWVRKETVHWKKLFHGINSNGSPNSFFTVSVNCSNAPNRMLSIHRIIYYFHVWNGEIGFLNYVPILKKNHL